MIFSCLTPPLTVNTRRITSPPEGLGALPHQPCGPLEPFFLFPCLVALLGLLWPLSALDAVSVMLAKGAEGVRDRAGSRGSTFFYILSGLARGGHGQHPTTECLRHLQSCRPHTCLLGLFGAIFPCQVGSLGPLRGCGSSPQ